MFHRNLTGVSLTSSRSVLQIQFLRSLKAAIKGGRRLGGIASEAGGNRQTQTQKTIRQLEAVFLAIYIPLMFQDIPVVVSAAYPPGDDGVSVLDTKRVAGAVWICVQLLGAISAGGSGWYTQQMVADYFRPLLQLPLDEKTRLQVMTLRDSSVEAHRGIATTCAVLCLVGLVVRVPPPWWTITRE